MHGRLPRSSRRSGFVAAWGTSGGVIKVVFHVFAQHLQSIRAVVDPAIQSRTAPVNNQNYVPAAEDDQQPDAPHVEGEGPSPARK